MKNRMKLRKSIGKISSFLRDLKKPYRGATSIRSSLRRAGMFPSSTKVGAGGSYIRRSLPQQILHKRNHRDNQIVQGPINK